MYALPVGVLTAKHAETFLEQSPCGSLRSAIGDSASSPHHFTSPSSTAATLSLSAPHMSDSRSSRRSWSTSSLEGSSPEISAFLLGLSGNDVISSSDAGTDSDNEQGGLPRSRGRLDSSSEESGSEGSVKRWVSSLGVSRKQGSPRFLSRAKPAPALRPRARAAGGELAAARARTPAAALTALHSRSRGSVSTVRPAAALSAVATAASLSASQPAYTATAAPMAQTPSASLIAAAPAAAALSAMAAAAAPSAVAPSPSLRAVGLPACSPASSIVRPTAIAALTTVQSESAQAHAGQLTDADDVAGDADAAETETPQAAETDAEQRADLYSAEAGADALAADTDVTETGVVQAADAVQPAHVPSAQASGNDTAADTDAAETGVVQAAEAGAIQPANFHSVGPGADDPEVGVTQAADTDAAQPASADAIEAVQSAASDALTVSMNIAHHTKAGAQSAAPHQGTNGNVQHRTSEGQEFDAGNADSANAAREQGFPSDALMALGSKSTQPSAAAAAAANQSADVHSPVAAAAPQKALSFKQVQDSYWHHEEDLDAGDEYFSAFGPWTEARAPTKAAPSVGPVIAAESLGPVTAAPSVEPVTAAPSVGPVTAAPGVGPETAAPSVQPETAAPSVGPVTAAPSVGPATAAPSVGPVTAAAAQEAAAPLAEDIVGSNPSAEHVNPAAEGALQLGGLTFGSITSADLLGVEQRQHGSKGTAGSASSVVAAAAPATASAAAPAVTAAYGSAAVGSTAVGASGASVVPVDTAVAGLDTAVCLSTDRSGAAAEVIDQSASVSQLGISRYADGKLTHAQTSASDADSATLREKVAAVEEEEEGEYQHAGLSGHGLEDLHPREECWEAAGHEEAVDTSLEYTAFLTDSLLGRMEQQAGSHADKIKALGEHCLHSLSCNEGWHFTAGWLSVNIIARHMTCLCPAG